MPFRVTDSPLPSVLADRIAQTRQRIQTAQEHVLTGKRINRPSDDPYGSEAVLHFRTAQAAVEQFQQSAAVVKEGLQLADASLEQYEQLIDRAQTLLTQGASGSSTPASRQLLAQELDGIRTQMLAIANTSNDDRYIFGGTRQDVPPFDANGTAAAAPTSQQFVQIEPNAVPIAAGITADSVFSGAPGTVFSTLTNAAAALRGTIDPAADQAAILAALDSLGGFTNRATEARAQLGTNLNSVEGATARMSNAWLSFQGSADRFELADMVQSAMELTQANNTLQATLQASSFSGKGSLMDFIG